MKDLKSWCTEHNRQEILNCYVHGNNSIPPESIGFSSGKHVSWKCSKCGQEWTASPNKMNRKNPKRTVCPFCSHERPSKIYNAALLYPELVHYWDNELNSKGLDDYLPQSDYNAHWRCKHGHTWTRKIDEQVKSVKRYRSSSSPSPGGLCPYCSHKRVSSFYNLQTVYPDVAKQWDYSKNGSLTPRNISPANPKKVFWRCSFDPSHSWSDRISNRTLLLRGCPICSKHFHISYSARAIYYYFQKYQIPCICEAEVPESKYIIDIKILSQDNCSADIALEIDGYHHRNSKAAERDAKKDTYLKGLGYRVIRVKETSQESRDITIENETITYPMSNRYIYLDRVIQILLMMIGGIHADPDHVKDHWKIEEFYYHTRKERSLAVLYPELAKEWSSKNKETPDVVSPGFSQKRWWKCPKCQKEYLASVNNRTRLNSSCPYCSHLKVSPQTSLAAVRPDVASEWDYEKNAPLKPTDVLPGTDKKVWWKCKYGHSWKAYIYSRTGPHSTECPFCQGHSVEPSTSLASKFPQLAEFWHSDKNPVSPDKVAPYSNTYFWWKCKKGHEWKDLPKTLQKYPPERICPYCDGRRISKENSLETQNPPLAALWHPLKNTYPASQSAPFSSKRVWWVCSEGHEWQASPGQMQKYGVEKACPFCANRKTWYANSLAHLSPELSEEWSKKNLPLKPEDIAARSSKMIWWKCKNGHEWQTSPAKRYIRGDGCPYCSGHRVCIENCLAVLYPRLAEEWDNEKNPPLTPYDITAKSGKTVWWKCKYGHSWQTAVCSRTSGRNCPFCFEIRRKKQK